MNHKAGNDFFEFKRPWSRYKDSILDYYLSPYLAKVARIGKPILIVDCFAGPGRFRSGEDGSPRIIANRAREAAARGAQVQVILIEKDAELADRLRSNVEEFGDLCEIVSGDTFSQIDTIASRLDGCTSMLYIDPFSIDRLYLSELGKMFDPIRRNNSVEVLINLMVPQILRWARACLRFEEIGISEGPLADNLCVGEEGDFDEEMAKAFYGPSEVAAAKSALSSSDKIDRIVGGDYWRSLAAEELNPDVYSRFVHLYRSKLARWFSNTIAFPIFKSETSQIANYWLVWGSRYRPAIDLFNRALFDARSKEIEDSNPLFSGTTESFAATPDLAALIRESILPGSQKWNEIRFRVAERSPGHFTDTQINNKIKSMLASGTLTGAAGRKIEDNALLSCS